MPIVIYLREVRYISVLPRFDIHARRQVENRHRSHAFNGRRRDQNRQTGTSTRLSAALRPCPATCISHANANASNTPAVYQHSPTSSATQVRIIPPCSTTSCTRESAFDVARDGDDDAAWDCTTCNTIVVSANTCGTRMKVSCMDIGSAQRVPDAVKLHVC